MVVQVGVHEAKTRLSELLRRVDDGEEVIIARGGDPVAKLIAVEASRRHFGRDRGVFEVPDDFDAPLPEDVLADFEA